MSYKYIDADLKEAGLLGLPFSWGADGSLEFGDVTEDQRAAIQAVFDNYDEASHLAKQMVMQIDADVDAIYAAAIGNRGPEYTAAEAAANAYKDAGYSGTVPSEVQSWADAKSWTAQQAADDILLAAAQLNGAKQLIRAQRLLRKEEVRNAEDQAGIDTAMAAWNAFVVQIKAQLGLG